MIERIADGKFCICVNACHTPARQRFTIAHELGHYIIDWRALSIAVPKGTKIMASMGTPTLARYRKTKRISSLGAF